MPPEFKVNDNYRKIQEDSQLLGAESDPTDNNLNLKQTANGQNYIFIAFESISRDETFKERFNKKDDVDNASMPYISDKVNWGGTVSFTNHDMSRYSMSGLELEEGNYIAIPVHVDNKISYTYTSVPEADRTTVELKYLYYEVIE